MLSACNISSLHRMVHQASADPSRSLRQTDKRSNALRFPRIRSELVAIVPRDRRCEKIGSSDRQENRKRTEKSPSRDIPTVAYRNNSGRSSLRCIIPRQSPPLVRPDRSPPYRSTGSARASRRSAASPATLMTTTTMTTTTATAMMTIRTTIIRT